MLGFAGCRMPLPEARLFKDLVLGGPGLSRVISTLDGDTPNNNSTFYRLTKSPGPPSIGANSREEDREG